MTRTTILIGFLSLFALSCKDENTIETPRIISGDEILISNLVADTGNTLKHTLFSFSKNEIIANSDSNSGKWDIAFQATNLKLNGGSSGPGNCTGQMIDALYDEIYTLPTSGYNEDSSESLALSQPGPVFWYSYNQQNHVISPRPGKVLLIKLSDGQLVKMEILSYYLDNPSNPTLETPSRYYHFKYQIIKQQ